VWIVLLFTNCWHHKTSYHITSHHITAQHITPHHITSRHITSHHIPSQHHITFTTPRLSSNHITPHYTITYHTTLCLTFLHTIPYVSSHLTTPLTLSHPLTLHYTTLGCYRCGQQESHHTRHRKQRWVISISRNLSNNTIWHI
jgi:hypothetical protein